MLPMEVLDIPSTEYELLERYWFEEPWGPWRDNLHAAIVAHETLKAGGFKGMKHGMFMYRPPDLAKQKTAGDSLMTLFKTVAVRKKRKK